MWTYQQSTGAMSRGGKLLAEGYSGFGDGKNKPTMQDVHNVGPIPQGDWTIGPVFDDPNHPGHGPAVMQLAPKHGTETFGRTGFLIHADAPAHPGSASQGCVILPRFARDVIANSGDKDLQVVA